MTKMSKNYSDKELKDQGNKLFAARNYDGAIECYTKAIMKNPSVPHYYTNRALCYLNQKRWPQAITDAKMALERDQNLVKGHFYLGKNNKPILTGFFSNSFVYIFKTKAFHCRKSSIGERQCRRSHQAFTTRQRPCQRTEVEFW